MPRNNQKTTIGERLRSALQAKGLRQAWVAEVAGITAATLSNILTGRTTEPSFTVVQRIADAIGEPLGALLGERSEPFLESEREILRQAVEILERRVRPIPASASPGEWDPESERLPRHEIPAALRRQGVRMAFRAIGDVLNAEGIHDGDIVYVRPSTDIRAANGRVVVCRVDDKLLMRKLIVTGRGIRLEAADNYAPVMLNKGEFELLGVVVAHLGELDAR